MTTPNQAALTFSILCGVFLFGIVLWLIFMPGGRR